MDVTYKVILKGLVQGGLDILLIKSIYELGLKGWAKISTGEVELIVHGNKDTVNHFIFYGFKSRTFPSARYRI